LFDIIQNRVELSKMNCLNTWPFNVLCLVNKYYNTIQLLNIPPASISITTIPYNHNYSYNYNFSSKKWIENVLQNDLVEMGRQQTEDFDSSRFNLQRERPEDALLSEASRSCIRWRHWSPRQGHGRIPCKVSETFKAMTTKRLTWNDLDVLGFWNCLNVFKLVYDIQSKSSYQFLSILKEWQSMSRWKDFKIKFTI